MIDAYLRELGRELSGTRRDKRRILLEAESHLREAAERSELSGMEAEREAVARFGSPALVAAGFAAPLAARALERAALALLAGLILALPAVYGLSENLLPPATWAGDSPPFALRWKREAGLALVGVAALAGLGTYLSAHAGRLRAATASTITAAGALALAFLLWIVVAVEWSQQVPGAWHAFAAAGLAAVGLVTPAAVFSAAAARPLLRALK